MNNYSAVYSEFSLQSKANVSLQHTSSHCITTHHMQDKSSGQVHQPNA